MTRKKRKSAKNKNAASRVVAKGGELHTFEGERRTRRGGEGSRATRQPFEIEVSMKTGRGKREAAAREGGKSSLGGRLQNEKGGRGGSERLTQGEVSSSYWQEDPNYSRRSRKKWGKG